MLDSYNYHGHFFHAEDLRNSVNNNVREKCVRDNYDRDNYDR